MYKSGANFADQNRIREMACGDVVNEEGQPFTVDQIAAILQIKPDVVANWVDHFRGVASEDDYEEVEDQEPLDLED